MIKTLLNNHPLIIFFFSFAIVGVAIIFEHFGQYYACPLCILQRWAYIFCGLTALFLMSIKKQKRPFFKTVAEFKLCLFAMVGACFALRQIHLQSLNSSELMSISGCGMPLSTLLEYEGIFNGLRLAFLGGPSCAVEDWRLIFNFAEWSLIGFIVILLLFSSYKIMRLYE